MHKRFLMVCLALIFINTLSAQSVLYADERKQLRQYSNEQHIRIDAQEAKMTFNAFGKSFFVSNFNDFFYIDERVKLKIAPFAISRFWLTERNAVWMDGSNIFCIENYGIKKIAPFVDTNPEVNDRILSYTDRNGFFHIYEHENDTILSILPVINSATGSNNVAFVNTDEQFYYWLNDSLTLLEQFTPKRFALNKNCIAYINENNDLIIFEQNAKTTLQSNFDGFFYVGNEFVLFQNDKNELIVWHNNKKTVLSNYIPNSLIYNKNIIAFGDNSLGLHIWQSGEQKILESYFPRIIKSDYNGIAYLDAQQNLFAFYNGKHYQNLRLNINYTAYTLDAFVLNNGLLVYRNVEGFYKIIALQ